MSISLTNPWGSRHTTQLSFWSLATSFLRQLFSHATFVEHDGIPNVDDRKGVAESLLWQHLVTLSQHWVPPCKIFMMLLALNDCVNLTKFGSGDLTTQTPKAQRPCFHPKMRSLQSKTPCSGHKTRQQQTKHCCLAKSTGCSSKTAL